MRKPLVIVIALLISFCLAGWFFLMRPQPVVLLGFVGGISGRTADLGVAGRNGATLAVEIRNQAGGVRGQKIELLVEDDQQNPATVRQAVSHLLQQKVVAIIGPMTSDMAVASVGLVNEAGIPMIGPTVTTNTLTGLDDQFFRVLGTTGDYAKLSAQYHFKALGLQRVVIIHDQSNAHYSESWANDYTPAFENLGGHIIKRIGYVSGKDLSFTALAEKLVPLQYDGVLLIGNSVDAAMLSQRIRRINLSAQIMTAEWAATERLIELGGKAVEGLVVSQFLDRDNKNPAYLAFREAYLKRYSGMEPGFGAVTAFEATNIALDAFEKQTNGQSLKQTILSQKEFSGLQDPIRFDAYGDSRRETYITRITNARYTTVGKP